MFKYPAIISFLVAILITIQIIVSGKNNYTPHLEIIEYVEGLYTIYISPFLLLLNVFLYKTLKNEMLKTTLKIFNAIVIFISILYLGFIELFILSVEFNF